MTYKINIRYSIRLVCYIKTCQFRFIINCAPDPLMKSGHFMIMTFVFKSDHDDDNFDVTGIHEAKELVPIVNGRLQGDENTY